jgi:hypothetical protein
LKPTPLINTRSVMTRVVHKHIKCSNKTQNYELNKDNRAYNTYNTVLTTYSRRIICIYTQYLSEGRYIFRNPSKDSAVVFVVASQIKKQDDYSNAKVT